MRAGIDRRTFLSGCARGIGALALGPSLLACTDSPRRPAPGDLLRHGSLAPPDTNGVRVPAGFTSRVIAQSGELVPGTSHEWHRYPDGGATFDAGEGDFIYVSNSEFAVALPVSGVGAIRFDREGRVVDAYPILQRSAWNCSGGKTPWGTWLSAEEHDRGIVWDCDPFGEREAVRREALGVFKHEAVAIDPRTGCVYLTEDRPTGRFYRFTPQEFTGDADDLAAGALEVMRAEGNRVTWLPVPDPSAALAATWEQVPESSAFDGGEGVWCHEGRVYFTTKGDNRIWLHDIDAETLEVAYDAADYTDPVLTGVDFLLVTEGGDVVVGEDGGDMQIVAIAPDGRIAPLVQVVGHDGSEITGIAFDPSLGRLIFSSQRGPGGDTRGVTFMVEGPFFDKLPSRGETP